jgi:hypothetical protein
MPIDPGSVQWDAQAPDGIQWDDAPKPNGPPVPRSEKFKRGMRDPLDGAAQLLYNILPQGVQQAGNRFNNWIADNTGLVEHVGEGGADQMVREANKAYEAKRTAAGESGIDGWRLSGNVLNPINLAAAAQIPRAVSLAGRIGWGALGGGATSLLQPATSEQDSFATEKAKQASIGAVVGGAVPIIGAGLSRLVSPKASTDPALALLRSEGVRPTIGQTLGGAANRLEEKAISLPFVGDAIASARRRAAADLNDAVANRALAPIGQTMPKGLQGREAVAHVQQTLSDAYESLLPRMSVKADQVFGQEIGTLRQMVGTGSMDPKAAKLFDRILQNDVMGKFRGQQVLTGKTMKAVESDLGAQISRLQQSTDADSRLVADALREVQSSLRNLAARNNPQLADELGKINQGWANFKRLERAASYVGAEDGMFSPANLQSAVKALDKSKDKGRFARGGALMQDLSDAAKSRLGDKVPNSGTADRLMSGGVLGAGFLDPMIPGSFLAGAGLYSSPVQGLLRSLVTSRPQGAQAVAGLLEQGAPMLAPAGGLLALQGLQ